MLIYSLLGAPFHLPEAPLFRIRAPPIRKRVLLANSICIIGSKSPASTETLTRRIKIVVFKLRLQTITGVKFALVIFCLYITLRILKLCTLSEETKIKVANFTAFFVVRKR